MPSQFKVHELLSRQELDELEIFAREPGRSYDEIHDWLLSHGFTVGRTAAGNWYREFKSLLMKERFSRSGELAQVIKTAIQGGQLEDVADAAAMQLTQVVFEQSAQLQEDGEIDTGDVLKMTMALRNLVKSKEGLVKLLAAKLEREMRALKGKGKTIDDQTIADVRKAVFGV
jgi:hypothetical protein